MLRRHVCALAAALVVAYLPHPPHLPYLPFLPSLPQEVHAQSRADTWLDQPLNNWNRPGAALAVAPVDRAGRDEIMQTCHVTLRQATAAERAVAGAGWISFLNFDQELVREGLEIVNGMADADGMCRPRRYNVFVFVDGRFAGTLSPRLMNAREDGTSGAVRILDRNTISAEFQRYTQQDPLCCPSSRVTVRYRIDRSGPRPLVAPTDLRVTRGQ